jgi:two-component system, NtrC family, sensor histidine kinase KinB
MNLSIRTKFTLGMIFLFLIILVLSIFSAFYLNKLSKKTSAILKENYLSVVYAREMSEGLTNINQEITNCFLMNRYSDSLFIKKELDFVHNSLELEKNNITEPGEDKLVSGIESGINEYCDSVAKFIESPQQVDKVLYLQKKSGILYQQLVLLSQINGKAIEVKTDDAKVSSKNALTQMTILATFCFLIAFSFTFSFASYFNERFFQLYNGMKEIGSNNYDQRLYFHGKDEFYEISLVFNEMAEKLNENKKKMSLTLPEDLGKDISSNDVQELKNMLFRIKSLEEQALALISKFEKK